MNKQVGNNNWEGYKNIILPLGHRADVNNLTLLASIMVDQSEGKIHLLHVIEEGKYSHLPHEWRIGSERVTESHHLLMSKGVHSERQIVTFSSIEKGILEQTAENKGDVILLGWGPKPKSSISSLVSHIMNKASCDVIIFKTRNNPVNTKNILYPIAIEPDIERLRMIKRIMNSTDSTLTLSHVLSTSSNKEAGRKLLKKAAEKAHKIGIKSDTKLVTGENITQTIADLSEDYDLMILGPSGGWWLKKTLFGHKTDKIASRSNCSVLMHKGSED